MAEIKFCSVCGSKVAESDQFCGSCVTKMVNLQKDDRIEEQLQQNRLKIFYRKNEKTGKNSVCPANP